MKVKINNKLMFKALKIAREITKKKQSTISFKKGSREGSGRPFWEVGRSGSGA